MPLRTPSHLASSSEKTAPSPPTVRPVSPSVLARYYRRDVRPVECKFNVAAISRYEQLLKSNVKKQVKEAGPREDNKKPEAGSLRKTNN
uniref:DET1- and DDB1-associated protein 1 n=1 Tax=Steinernema glaseri TaxID=37863 RepID=A0A1I7ZBW5_9BILA